ncbi:MAG: HD domain-containing protein [Chloroflexi bacterium]|nr:HD domain-containing protein [Chloroflexota bacterium]
MDAAKVIVTALELAEEAHEGFARPDGTPYYFHVLNVASLLADWRAPAEIVAAGLLHDSQKKYRSRNPSLEHIRARMGKHIAELVLAVSELGKYEPYKFIDNPELRMDETFLASYVDTRLPWIVPALQKHPEAAIIRLASRLEKLQSWKDKSAAERENYITATLNMFVPVANRLGMWEVKRLLEDHAFRLLYPSDYQMTCERFSDADREEHMQPVLLRLRQRYADKGVNADIDYEPMSRYSQFLIHVKNANTLNRCLAYPIRIITNSEQDCYAALGVVHGLWPPVSSEFRDLISAPKTNNYRALRTKVHYNRANTVSILIRDREMELVAEWGLAAGWRGAPKNALPKPPTWQEPAPDRIVVFTVDGDSRALPVGSTPVDFAYAIDSQIGHQCVEAYVNHRKVPLFASLDMGDVVEIRHSAIGTAGPSAEWLNRVKSSRARREIRRWLERGAQPQTNVHSTARMTSEHHGSGIGEVHPSAMDSRQVVLPNPYTDLQPRFPKCCNPFPPDPIVGRLTKDKHLTVHRSTCRNVKDSTSLVSNIRWQSYKQPYAEQLEIVATDGAGLVHEVSSVFAGHDISFSNFVADSMPDGSALIQLGAGPVDPSLWGRILEQIRGIKRVQHVKVGPLGRPMRYSVGGVADHAFANPYTLKPVTGDMFFGRTKEMQELVDNLRGVQTWESVLLWGPRRIGKTSLLLEVSKQLRDQPGGYAPVYVDMLGVSQGNTVELLALIAAGIASSLSRPGTSPPEFGRLRREPLGTFRSFMEHVRRREDRQLILILDEFEVITKLREDAISREDIFYYLRSQAQKEQGISLIFAAGGRLDTLLHRTGVSPLLNIAHYQKVGCLDRDTARKLVTEPVKPFATYSDEVIERLLELTGCHPYYLQLLCHALTTRTHKQHAPVLDSTLLDAMLTDWLPYQPESCFDHLWGTSIGLDPATEEQNRQILIAIAKQDNKCLSEEQIRRDLQTRQINTEEIAGLLKHLVDLDALEQCPQGYRFKVELCRLWIRENY